MKLHELKRLLQGENMYELVKHLICVMRRAEILKDNVRTKKQNAELELLQKNIMKQSEIIKKFPGILPSDEEITKLIKSNPKHYEQRWVGERTWGKCFF